MLVLSRKPNERIVVRVGDVKVTIAVMEVRGDKVRLGFDAPREVLIDRQEVYSGKMNGVPASTR